MQNRTQIYLFLTLTLVIILVACSPQVNNNLEVQPSPTATELPAFKWRNPNPVPVSIGDPILGQTISLVEPDLCLEEIELTDTLRNADGTVTLLFQPSSGRFINHPDEMFSPEDIVAVVEGVEQLYTCEIGNEEGDLLACTGPDIPAGSEISVRFGEVSGGVFENLAGTSKHINLPELWSSRQTNLEAKFDFQLADETAFLFGYPTPQNLQDAYDLITAGVSLNEIPGGGWGGPTFLLMSSLPQFQKTGLVCDSYWECARACAKEINYDLKSDDLIGAFDFYKKYASKLGALLPDTCQAFNTYAKTLTPRPVTPQYLEYQWQGVTTDRLELYDPSDQLFDLYDSNYNWEPLSIPTAIDVIPDDIKQCAADNGWPYGEITDLEAFLNWYFNTLFGYRGEESESACYGTGSLNCVFYQTTYSCTSEEARDWIELATNEISGNPEHSSDPYSDTLLNDCVDITGYEIRMWPNEFDEEDIPGFLVWLFDLWSQSPESVINACTAYFASDEFQAHLGDLHSELDLGESICTAEQEAKIQQLQNSFQYYYGSCGIDEADACPSFSPICQEDAFVNSLIKSGIMDGPSTCLVDPNPGCTGESNEFPFVPPGVWECAMDTCGVGQYPLHRGEGVYGFSFYLNTEFQNGGTQLPDSCMTAEVGQWVYQNYDCASENYADDTWDYSSCGLPYQDMSSGNCFAIPSNGGYITYCLTEPADQNCPSCSTVYQCAEGEESIFCNESPEGEDPGYWSQLDLCAEQIEWEGGIQTYQDASDLIQYLVTAAPFLKADDIPAACKVSVDQTLIPGLPYGEFLTKLTLGGKVEGSSACSEAKQFTIPEEPVVDRCAEFNPSQYRLTILDIPYNSNLVSLYLTMPGGVPGLEREVADDPRPWEYSGVLGSVEAGNCGFYDYPNRLYCSFAVPLTYMETVRPLQISVNGCEVPIYAFQSVSLIPQEAPQNQPGGQTCSPPPGGCPTGGVSSGGLTQGYFDTSTCSCKMCPIAKVWNGSACIRP